MPAINKKTILLIEDDKNTCEVYSDELIEKGYNVELANDGKHAIELLNTINPDLVVLDVKLPILEGREVLENIRKRKIKLPVIVCTAFPLKDEEIKMFENISDWFVTKPIDLDILISKIKSFIS